MESVQNGAVIHGAFLPYRLWLRNLKAVAMLVTVLFTAMSMQAQTGPDPFATWLQSLPKPVFNPNNRLKPLTYTGWGWQLSNAVVQLAQNYGYAADIGGPTPYWIGITAKSGYTPNGLAQHAFADTNFLICVPVIKTPVVAYLPAQYQTTNTQTGLWFAKSYYCTNSAGQYVDNQGRYSDSAQYYVTNGVTNGTFYPVISPCFPDSEAQRWTDCQILLLKMMNSNCPLAVIRNDGEWGLPAYSGGNWKAFWSDPRFISAMNALGVTNTIPPTYSTDPKIYDYLSHQKAREINQLADGIRTNFPRVLYYFYNTSMEKFRFYGWNHYGSTNTLDGMNAGDGWDSAFIATNFAYPTSEVYFHNSNNGMTNLFSGSPVGISPNFASLLTQQLNWKAWNISQGKPLSYDYVTAGWTFRGVGTNATGGVGVYPDARYIGFLKCLYTMGMVGANMGWYGNDGTTNANSFACANFNAAFDTNNVPSWMSQMVVLSHVHAEFSWLQDYLYNGSLVPGPYTNAMSWDLNNYDFAPETYNGSVNLPGGYKADNTAHVFIRKKNTSNDWLITAWTSADTNETVTVTVPILGTVTLNARTNGAVYLATTSTAQSAQDTNVLKSLVSPTPTLILQDTNGLYPTVWRGTISAAPQPPARLRILD